MNDTTTKQDGETSPRQPLGTPVRGAAPVSPASAHSPALQRILQRIDDPALREQLLTTKGGQFCRAVASEIDLVMGAIDQKAAATGPATIMTDVEAEALIRYLDDHFSISGHVPASDQRLVMRTMLTLKGLADQVMSLQRAVSKAGSSGTPNP